jgi:hypothetical protein
MALLAEVPLELVEKVAEGRILGRVSEELLISGNVFRS